MTDDLSQRLLPLEGGVNFRDMGGYATQDGRRVKWGHLFRSGTMTKLSEADCAHLNDLGFRTVVDLRTLGEQERDPNHWGKSLADAYWSREHDETFGDLHRQSGDSITTLEEGMAVMEQGYRRLPFQQCEGYAHLFRRLAEGHFPAVIHCTAGKDRTGGGAALVLAALGVPRESIVADFVMTERAVDLRKALGWRKPSPKYTKMSTIPDEARSAFVGAKASYIEAFLDALDSECGSLDGYLRHIGVASENVERMRAALLE